MFTVVNTWLGVLAGGKKQIDDRKCNVMRTIEAKVLDPYGPYILVQNGDAAYSSSKRQVIDYRYEVGPEKIYLPQQYGAGGCATHAWYCLLVVLLEGSF